MGTRYYKFFAMMRMAQNQNKLEFSAPGNKTVNRVLTLLREKGLISGFCLDYQRNKESENMWCGYPKYKVYLKYSYFGEPVIKKIDCYKLTRTNYLLVRRKYPVINNNNFWLVVDKSKGIVLLNQLNAKRNNSRLLAKIKV